MEKFANALADFSNAERVMVWLAENGQLKDGANIGELAYSFAIAYESPSVIAAFRQVALIERSDREHIAAQPKRRRAPSDEEAVAELQLNQDRLTIREESRNLACELAPVVPPGAGA